MSILDSLAATGEFTVAKPAEQKKASGITPSDIPLTDIAADPDQPRKQFDQSVIDSLAVQFVDPEIGQLEPIFIRKSPRGDSGPEYLIVHGETRYRAAMQAGLETIKAVVTTEHGFVRQLLSNETRADLDIFDKARAYRQVIEEHGITQKRLAEILGKDEDSIARHLKLLELPELALQAYSDGKATTVRVLHALGKLINAQQKPAAKRKRVEQFVADTSTITVAAINALSKQLSTGKRTPKSKPTIDGQAVAIKSIVDDQITLRVGKVNRLYRLVEITEQGAENTGETNDGN